MSRTRSTLVEDIEIMYPCEVCYSRPYEWCTNMWGEYTSYLHTNRYNQAHKDKLLPLPDYQGY